MGTPSSKPRSPIRSVLLAVLLGAWGCDAQAPLPDQPNLIVVSLDTVRWDHTGLAGYARDTTPVLDALAAQPGSITFTQAFTPAAWSLPAYASLFTGMEALEHEVGFLRTALDPQASTLAEALSAYGYATGAFCSGPHLDPSTGLDQGFTVYQHEVPMRSLGDRVGPSLAWMEQQQGPFFAFVQGYDAHAPYPAPTLFSELFDPGAAEVSHGACSPGGERSCAEELPFEGGEVARLLPGHATLVVDARLQGAGLEGEEKRDLSPSSRSLLRALMDVHLATPGHTLPTEELLERAELDAASMEEALVELHGLLGHQLLREEGAVGLALTLSLRPEDPRGDRDEKLARDTVHTVAHYDAAVLNADLQLGRLLQGLEVRGLLDSSVVVVLADHGEALGETGVFGHDDQHGERVFHVPLVVHLPTDRPPERVDALVSLSGLTPSLLGVLDLVVPAAATGPDFSAALLGASWSGPESVPGASHCCYAVWTADWELVGPIAEPMAWALHARGGNEDLSATHPEVVEALAASVAHWPGRLPSHEELLGEQLERRPDLKEALQDGGYWDAEEER